jgi:hypothetical protein
MSLPPRTFFAGLESCLDDIAGELSGETDISSSSALRFLEAMVYCGTAKGSINLTRGFGDAQNNRFLVITQRRIPTPPKIGDGGRLWECGESGLPGMDGGIREGSHWRAKVGGCGDKRTFIVCGRQVSKQPANDELTGRQTAVDNNWIARVGTK